MLKIDEIELHYEDDARSVHTLLRVIDPDNHERTKEVLFDNLYTVMALVVHYELRVRQETLGFVPLTLPESVDAPLRGTEGTAIEGVTGSDILHGWRQHASGSSDEALIVECYGDPDLLGRL